MLGSERGVVRDVEACVGVIRVVWYLRGVLWGLVEACVGLGVCGLCGVTAALHTISKVAMWCT